MILLDKPYVSEILLDTIRDHGLPVVITAASRQFGVEQLPSAISEQEAVTRATALRDPPVYVVSESSFGWIAEHLGATRLPGQIEVFKDKARFRRETAALFPGLEHREVGLADLARFDPASFPTPFVIKPAVGFLSLGVRRVERAAQWPGALAALQAELARAAGIFPPEVLDTSRFLIESCISGREFAVDAYYDEQGRPVVLSILEHLFASADDTTDRVYVTSRELILEHLERFTALLAELGGVFDVRNFPVHLELRVDAEGRCWPIEVNPARFGGWCTTADLTVHAFGLNPYACYFAQQRPDWERVLRGKQGQLFGLVALGNSSGVPGRDIAGFDYDGVLARFEQPLELRRIDYRTYPVFGFLFTRTRADNLAELEWALGSDLREFVSLA